MPRFVACMPALAPGLFIALLGVARVACAQPAPDAGAPDAGALPAGETPSPAEGIAPSAPAGQDAAPPAKEPVAGGEPASGEAARPESAPPLPEQQPSEDDKARKHKHEKHKHDGGNEGENQGEIANQAEGANSSEGANENNDKPERDGMLGDPFGDDDGGIHAGPISFRVLLQARYTQAFAASSDDPRPGYSIREDTLVHSGDGFRLNRFFLRIGADPVPEVGVRAIIDFAQFVHGGAGGAVKQAYGTLRAIPKHLEFHAGIFKLPFSTLELDPIAKFELANLGPSDDLIKDLGFGGRDEGADLMVAPLSKSRWLRIYVGAFRGHSHDEHASPVGAVGGRVESKPWKGLRLGADMVGFPSSVTYLRALDTSKKEVLPAPDDPLYPRAQHFASGTAYSADITFTHARLMLRAEGMLGTRVDIDTRYGARHFFAVWGIAAYRFKVGPLRLMPALRAEWLDTDSDHAAGVRRVLTAGVSVLFTKYVRLLLDVTRTDVEPGTPVLSQPLPLAAFPYLDVSNTMFVAQLQVAI